MTHSIKETAYAKSLHVTLYILGNAAPDSSDPVTWMQNVTVVSSGVMQVDAGTI